MSEWRSFVCGLYSDVILLFVLTFCFVFLFFSFLFQLSGGLVSELCDIICIVLAFF